jgi:glycosyl transferase family 87
VRTQAVVLCGCLALIFLLNLAGPGLVDRNGQVKGTDFLHFYVIGSLVVDGRDTALYDVETQTATAVKLVPESRNVFYLPVYGPQVALLYAPLALLPYGWALAVWLGVTALVYGICIAGIWRTCPSLRGEKHLVALLAAASPAFFNLLAHGQNSAIALAAFTAAFLALRRGRHFLAGVAIGMLVYKPQLGLAAACIFVLTAEWRVIAGALAGAGAQLGIAWAWFGTDVLRRYLETLRHVGDVTPLLDIKPFQMHSLLSFWRLLLPDSPAADAIYALCAVATLVGLVAIWRRPAPLGVRYAALLLSTVLVSPHLNVYDLVILAPGLLLLADWWLTRPAAEPSRTVGRLLYAVYVLPLFGVVTQHTHVQLSVAAMTGLFAFVAVRVLDTGALAERVPLEPGADGWCQVR